MDHPASRSAPSYPRPGLSELAGQRIVVTGATGFLAGYVIRQLRAARAEIVAVVQRSRAASRHEELNESIETLWFDHASEIAATVRGANPDYVIHLHAAISTQRTTEAFRATLEANLIPSLELMSACTEIPVKKLVLLGTGEEFGSSTGPFDESTLPDPPSPYGASKAAITTYARMFHTVFKLPVVVLRPSVIYGPGQASRMLIPQVMHALREGRAIPVTEGRQTRDFIHVEDVARGILAALVAQNVTGHSYNLASGEIVTVRDCLEKIEAITGLSGLIQYGALPYKPGEIFVYEPISAKTFTALHWRPSVWLEDGLAETWASLQ